MNLDKLNRLFVKGLINPKRAFQYLYWKTVGLLHCLPRKLFLRSQKDLMHEVVEGDDDFLIVVLDACRFDYFRSEYKNYLKGDLKPVYSSGRDTFEYVSNTWTGSYRDVFTYVSGAPPVNSVLKDVPSLYGGYVPSNHLDIVDVWEEGWSSDKGSCMPESVVDSALSVDGSLVVHFFQPHAPYIGEGFEDIGGSGSAVDGNRFGGTDRVIWERLRQGEVPVHRVKSGYRSNLKIVFEQVQRLVTESDFDRVVVTSDHGELFDGGVLVAHPRLNHPVLRVVPWLEVSDVVYTEGEEH